MLWGATMGAASAGGAGGAVGAGTGGVIGAVEFAPLVGGSCPPSRLIISGVEVWPLSLLARLLTAVSTFSALSSSF